MGKDKVKLLLNLVASADHGAAARRRHRGADGRHRWRTRASSSDAAAPARARRSTSASSSPASRPPALDAMTIQAYYTWRLAGTAGMRLEVLPDGPDSAVGKAAVGEVGRAQIAFCAPQPRGRLAQAAPCC